MLALTFSNYIYLPAVASYVVNRRKIDLDPLIQLSARKQISIFSRMLNYSLKCNRPFKYGLCNSIKILVCSTLMRMIHWTKAKAIESQLVLIMTSATNDITDKERSTYSVILSSSLTKCISSLVLAFGRFETNALTSSDHALCSEPMFMSLRNELLCRFQFPLLNVHEASLSVTSRQKNSLNLSLLYNTTALFCPISLSIVVLFINSAHYITRWK